MGHLRLYNTRTHSVEEFEPIGGDRVRIYACGLTPSAQAHLGHARSFIFFDVLRRHLEYRGYDVTYVQNVTDIDDRSIAAARERGVTYRDVVRENYSAFKASMQRLDVREPDLEPYATSYIPQIQKMIRALVASGHAYAVEDGIYYAVASFPQYGMLSRRNLDELQAGARIEVGEHKKNPLDFALWKFAKPGEPSWPFVPYEPGRPGWHIECSAMSHELLDPQGNGFEIHGGGADLIFPHHENEIAQSEPLMVHPPMAKYWVHGGLLLFDSRKMSKSLGNFEPLTDVLERHDPQAIRLLFLQTGYRKVMNFTEESIGAAGVVLARLKNAYRILKEAAGGNVNENGRDGLLESIGEALDDDMNTAVALARLLEFADEVGEAPDAANAAAVLRKFETALVLLGIEPKPEWLEAPSIALHEDFLARIGSFLDPSVVHALDGLRNEEVVARVVFLRDEARKRKDWKTSDALRDALASCGVALHDGPEGTRWSVVSS